MSGRAAALGEFGLIERLRRLLPPGGDAVVEGIGDDCAVIRAGGRLLLATCDAAVEDVHFSRAYAPAEDIGWRCGAAALSDIAAMGGQPLFMLVTLACPKDAELDFVDGLYRGLAAVATANRAAIVGGDTVRSTGGFWIDIAAVGEPASTRYLPRGGAQPGDVLAVTGWPGLSAAGLEALQRGIAAPALCRAHLHPEPRMAAGQWLAAQPGARAMIDVSDGLLQDAGHLAERSGLSLCVESPAVPIAAALTEAMPMLARPPLDYALRGGEDYELLVALDPHDAAAMCDAFAARHGLPLTPVGHFTAGPPHVLCDEQPATGGGYDHFR